MNECLYCKGQLEERRVSRLQEYNGRWHLIEIYLRWYAVNVQKHTLPPTAHD